MPIYGFASGSLGTYLVVQWLRLQISTAGGMGSILGWGTKIPHTVQPPKKKKMLWPKCSKEVSSCVDNAH